VEDLRAGPSRGLLWGRGVPAELVGAHERQGCLDERIIGAGDVEHFGKVIFCGDKE